MVIINLSILLIFDFYSGFPKETPKLKFQALFFPPRLYFIWELLCRCVLKLTICPLWANLILWPSPYFPFWPDQIKSATSIPDLSLCPTKFHFAIERGNYRSWIIYVTSKAESDHMFYYSFIWSLFITCFVYLFMYCFCRREGGVPGVFGFVTIKLSDPPPLPPPHWKLNGSPFSVVSPL